MSDLRIHTALSPRVAVLCSPDVDRVVQLNGIPDLPTLLRPFESSVQRLSVRTSQLETRICDRFPLRFDPYSLFNADAAHAISSSNAQAPPNASALDRSHQELLDRVNHLIAANIKKWDAQVPTTPTSPSLPHQLHRHDQHQDANAHDDTCQVLDETLVQLQQRSIEDITPWFTAVQQLVFGQRTIAKHDSFSHPVAVLLAVSSTSPDPMNDFAKLYEASSHPSPFPAHPYINPDTLKYYVLIHDVRTSGADLTSSKEILEQIKKTYGLHCCLLAINSASEESAAARAELAALWSAFLPSTPTSPVSASAASQQVRSDLAQMLDQEDVKRIKGFIRELTAQSIVPFMERYVQHMGDHLANSRKGLTNRLFGASRKLFGGVAVGASGTDKGASGSSASGGLSASAGYDAHHQVYAYSSLEAQTRRLADFAFTIRDYKLAASMYDLGRKDFAADKATRHSAGATEMFGLSHLMSMYTSQSAPIDVDSYLAQACYEYHVGSSTGANSGATTMTEENHIYALRATLLYYEAYRMLRYLRAAPAGLLRMSERSDEVLAPLLLEQAALACLDSQPKPSLRKFALYLITAAHKYQACGQKLLSMRCYALAGVVYRGKRWTLIENHIEHKLGMQAYNEGDSDTAVAHLIRLIRPSASSSAQHQRFLQDVQTAYKYSAQADQSGKIDVKAHEPLSLCYDMFDSASAVLRFAAESSASTTIVDDQVWRNLEQELVQNGLGQRTLADGSKKRRKPPTTRTSTQPTQVAINQPFWLDVQVRNPLNVDLTIDAIRPVLTTGTSGYEHAAAHVSDDDVQIDELDKLMLAPLQSKRVRVMLRLKRELKLVRVAGVRFRLQDTIQLVQQLNKKGARLNTTKQERTSVMYGPDIELAVSVDAARPMLSAQVSSVPEHMYLGQEVRLKVVLKNDGSRVVDDVRALCDQAHVASFASASGEMGAECRMSNSLSGACAQAVLDAQAQMTIAPGEQVEASLIVRPVALGEMRLAWLIAFGSHSDHGETYLTRMALSARVSDALQINVLTRVSRTLTCEHDVVVHATNMLTTDTIELDAISLVSGEWKMVGGVEPMRGRVVLAPRQVWSGQFRVARAPTAGVIEAEEYTMTRLQDMLLGRQDKCAEAPEILVYRTTHGTGTSDLATYMCARQQYRLRKLAFMFPTIKLADRRRVFTLWGQREMDVDVSFRVGPHRGRLVVYALTPGANRRMRIQMPPKLTRSLYAQTAQENASLVHHISRDPDQNPLVIHSLQQPNSQLLLVLRNLSDRYHTSVHLQLTGPHWHARKSFSFSLPPSTAHTALASFTAPLSLSYSARIVCEKDNTPVAWFHYDYPPTSP